MVGKFFREPVQVTVTDKDGVILLQTHTDPDVQQIAPGTPELEAVRALLVSAWASLPPPLFRTLEPLPEPWGNPLSTSSSETIEFFDRGQLVARITR